jgi:hypothetical protein
MKPEDSHADDNDRQAYDREDVREEMPAFLFRNEADDNDTFEVEADNANDALAKAIEQLGWNGPLQTSSGNFENDRESVEDYLDKKEHIAAIIFDYDYSEEEERPHEESCHNIAEEILSAMKTQEIPRKSSAADRMYNLLKDQGFIEHDWPDMRGPCLCSQCEFERERKKVLAAYEEEKKRELYIVTHEHRHGETVWLVDSNEEPSEEEVINQVMDSPDDFEPDREEFIRVFRAGEIKRIEV